MFWGWTPWQIQQLVDAAADHIEPGHSIVRCENEAVGPLESALTRRRLSVKRPATSSTGLGVGVWLPCVGWGLWWNVAAWPTLVDLNLFLFQVNQAQFARQSARTLHCTRGPHTILFA